MSAAKIGHSPPVSASSRPEWVPGLPAVLREAVHEYRLAETSEWEKLAGLSDNTILRGVDVSAANSVFDNGSFIAPASVDLTLEYDATNDSFDDTYPARIYFKIVKHGDAATVEIERIETDTSSFFE
jgi:hypothetical protein